MKSGMIINTKRETLKSKPTFRHHTKAYTLINGWYEWKREGNKKQPYYFFIQSLIKKNTGIAAKTRAPIIEASTVPI